MSSVYVPSDEMLLGEIRTIQNTQGAEIGLQKIYDHIKAEHPLWMFSMKRLRTIRKDHNLTPSPPTSDDLSAQKAGSTSASASKNSSAPEQSTGATASKTQRTSKSEPSLTMRLTFNVISDGRNMFIYTFTRPVPRKFCETSCDREAAFAFVNRLIDTCEKEIIATQAWKCTYCRERAMSIYSAPLVNFNDRPPSVITYGSLPVCVVASPCHGLAHAASISKLNDLQASGAMPKSTTEEGWVVHYHPPL